MPNIDEGAKVPTASTWPSAAAAGDPLTESPSAVFDTALFDAIFFDRDGTLVLDQPYNADPELVIPVPGAVAAVAAARRAGLHTGVLTNQSGIARGLLTAVQVRAVNRRVDDIFGPFDVWKICPHGPAAGCRCRKPAPGMILDACSTLGISPFRTAYIGDIGSDMGAAHAAGATGVLVPTAVTRPEEVVQAALVAKDLAAALQLLLGASSGSTR
ncbi:HAD-IIIA family hydrolase [Arthrobacter sp. H14-L1]|uniref:HAD-IIIA family hydrolase n=1 Tax=Arthrobacter sp. H14-L1 TaxID=2996697 RepID=UPI0022701D10|nr:HAD-IIIA family hydrolase [Arthrobacter sp. H14-L1]MCY0905213.1 HAD-IIIA family hydrolase [Arthrobacter sp. H14-L1]